MLRFQFHPTTEDAFEWAHYSIEGRDGQGYALLGWNDMPPDVDPEGQPMLQKWFDTLGDAMRFAKDSLGITKDRWAAPIGKSGSGRVAPPVPPRLKDNGDEDE